jgi:hypothetical protein
MSKFFLAALNGLGTEGIFRIPADYDEVTSVKCRYSYPYWLLLYFNLSKPDSRYLKMSFYMSFVMDLLYR